jgi:hypothetical protein
MMIKDILMNRNDPHKTQPLNPVRAPLVGAFARPVTLPPLPTAPPCTIREVGSVLRICNGITR